MLAPRQVFAENGVGQQRGSWFHEEQYSSGADRRPGSPDLPGTLYS
jgi:hypothetical protein